MSVIKVFNRLLSTSSKYLKKVTPNNLKGKKLSSQQWITRQLSDPYVEKAKMMNLRCRSAFKLIEMDDRFKVLNPGQIVIDCGAAPGSWSQVAVERTNSTGTNANAPQGMVISIDRVQFHKIEGATILGNLDFTTPEAQDLIKKILGDKKVDVVLSDMAPNATGMNEMDNENIINLCYSVLRFAAHVSKLDATLIVKLWQCGQCKTLQDDMLKFYNSVKIAKPNSSRSNSAEIFLVAREFKGLKTG